jgi:hypothetical protein
MTGGDGYMRVRERILPLSQFCHTTEGKSLSSHRCIVAYHMYIRSVQVAFYVSRFCHTTEGLYMFSQDALWATIRFMRRAAE